MSNSELLTLVRIKCPTCGGEPLVSRPKAAEIETGLTQLDELRAENARLPTLERAGEQLATIAFNLAQRTHLVTEERTALKSGYEAWDEAHKALGGTSHE